MQFVASRNKNRSSRVLAQKLACGAITGNLTTGNPSPVQSNSKRIPHQAINRSNTRQQLPAVHVDIHYSTICIHHSEFCILVSCCIPSPYLPICISSVQIRVHPWPTHLHFCLFPVSPLSVSPRLYFPLCPLWLKCIPDFLNTKNNRFSLLSLGNEYWFSKKMRCDFSGFDFFMTVCPCELCK